MLSPFSQTEPSHFRLFLHLLACCFGEMHTQQHPSNWPVFGPSSSLRKCGALVIIAQVLVMMAFTFFSMENTSWNLWECTALQLESYHGAFSLKVQEKSLHSIEMIPSYYCYCYWKQKLTKNKAFSPLGISCSAEVALAFPCVCASFWAFCCRHLINVVGG